MWYFHLDKNEYKFYINVFDHKVIQYIKLKSSLTREFQNWVLKYQSYFGHVELYPFLIAVHFKF